MRAEIEKLIRKAAVAADSADAMRFSQAAQNAANALCALSSYETNVDRNNPLHQI